MKKNLLLVGFVILISFCAFSQNPDAVLARAFYTLKHKRDSTKNDSIYTENMLLLIAKNSSVFSSFDKIGQGLALQKNTEEQTKNWTGPGLPRIKPMSGARIINTDDLFQFPTEKKIKIRTFLIRNYLYEEPLEDIKWELTDETKTIGKIGCQKATTTFKGRNWIAWFASEIPFETGPWKLNGLPGLILEAYDSKNEVQFLFNGFESVKQQRNTHDDYTSLDKASFIIIPKKVIKVSFQDILKLKKNMYENARGFYMAQLQATGGFVDDENEMAGFSFKKINNPIDLTENK